MGDTSGFWDQVRGTKTGSPTAVGKPTTPRAPTDQAAAAARQTPEYSEKQLVRLLGRLSATPQLNDEQRNKISYLLTGFKPKKVRALAGAAKLPEATTLELVDYARKAQGMEPLPAIAKREAKLTKIVGGYARAEPGWEQRHPGEDPSATGSGAPGFNVEKAQELAGKLPRSAVARATRALKQAGTKQTKYTARTLRQDAGSNLRSRGVGDVVAGMLTDPTTGQPNVLGTGLDIVSRPGQAVEGAITEGPPGAWRGLTGQEHYSPIRAFLQGIAGKSEAEARKIEAGLPGEVRLPANFAGDVATDPLTYLTFGTSAAAKQAIEHAAETVAQAGTRDAADIARGLAREGLASLSAEERALLNEGTTKLLRGAQGGIKFAGRTVVPGPDTTAVRKLVGDVQEAVKPASLVERAIVPRAGIKQAARRGEGWAQGLDHKLQNLLGRLHGEQSLADRQLVARVQHVVRQAGVGTEADLTQIRRALDIRAAEPSLTEGQRSVAHELRGVLDEANVAEKTLGIRGESTIPEGQYFPHQVVDTRRAKAALRDLERGAGSPLEHAPGGYTYQRTLPGSVEDVAARAGRDVFQTDPLKAVVRRGMESHADVANARFVDELASWTNDAGEPLLRKITPDTKIADIKAAKDAGLVEVEIPRIGPVLVHQEIAADVSRLAGVFSHDAATRAVLGAFDKYLAWWKSYATVPFPLSSGFTIRNMMGNWFLASWLPERGVRATIADYVRAGALQAKVAQGLRDAGDAFAHLDDGERAVIEQAFHTGALDAGFYRTDISEVLGSMAKPRLRDVGARKAIGRIVKRANPLSPNFGPIRAGTAFNSAVENNARLALFLRNVDKLGPDGAAQIVRKYLFDYNDLTPFERGVLKRVAPFYTWARKSIPVMLESFVKTPGRWSRIQQARQRVAEETAPQDLGPVPAWMQEQLGVPVGHGMFMPDLPYTTLAEASKPQDFLWNQIGGPAGLVKTLAENKLDRSFFSGRQFYPGQKTEAPFYLAPFVGGAEVYAGKDKVPATSPETINLLESAWPALSKLRTLFPTSQYDKDAATRRRLSMVGVNYWPLGDATVRSEVLRRIAQADAIRQALEYSGAKVPATADLGKPKKGKAEPVSSGTDAFWAKVKSG